MQPTTSRTTALLLSLLALASLWGCPTDIPPPRNALTDPQELLGAMKTIDENIQTIRFKDTALQYYGEEGRISVKQTILWGQPDRLRIQTYLPGIDSVAGVLVCACGFFAYHDRQENVYYYGEATDTNIARFVPVGLTCRDVGTVLIGSAPFERIAAANGEPALRWDRETGRYALSVPVVHGLDAGGKIDLQVQHETFRVARIQATNASGALVYAYEVDDFENVAGQILPRRRQFVVQRSGEDFSIKNGEVQLNPELPDEVFALGPPQGTPVRYLGNGLQRPAPQDGDLCSLAAPPPTTDDSAHDQPVAP